MSSYEDEIIAHIDIYTIYAIVEYRRAEEPIIKSIHIDPCPDADAISFSRDIVVKATHTIDTLIMDYLPQCKLCNQWLSEAILNEA